MFCAFLSHPTPQNPPKLNRSSIHYYLKLNTYTVVFNLKKSLIHLYEAADLLTLILDKTMVTLLEKFFYTYTPLM